MLMRGTVSGENYANLNVCYIGIGSSLHHIRFQCLVRLEMTHCSFGKRCILRLIETVKWLNGL